MLKAPPEIATITRYTADTPYNASLASSPSMIVLFIFDIVLSHVKGHLFRCTTTLAFYFIYKLSIEQNHVMVMVLNSPKYIILGKGIHRLLGNILSSDTNKFQFSLSFR